MATLGMVNTAQLNVLSAEFQRRNEQQFSLINAITILQAYHAKVGLWVMDSLDPSNGNTFDISGASRTLTNNNLVTFGNDGLIPYSNFDGAANNYLLRLDEAALDITGTETFVIDNGISMGGWFYFNLATGGTGEQLIGKWAGAGLRSYRLIRPSASTKVRLQLSVDGTAQFNVTSTNDAIQNAWNYVAGVFTPSGTSSIILNDTKTDVGGSPASIFNSTSSFTIGANAAGANRLDGRASMCALTASRIANQTIEGDLLTDIFFQQSRLLFGV